MKNKIENGLDWNIHENLKAFKEGSQNIHKTSSNIKKMVGECILQEGERRKLKFVANQERYRISKSDE